MAHPTHLATTDLPQRETVTLRELAAALDVGLTYAYEAARRNELPIPAIRVGRQFRFSRRALERLLEGGTTNQLDESEAA